MKNWVKALVIGAAVAGMAAPVFAEGDFKNQITARKSQMRLLAFNIGTLGGMAQGKIAYDAAAAQAAADNIAALASLHIDAMYPEGSDSFELEGQTRAKPEIWSNMAGFKAKYADLGAAANAMKAAAGGGLDSLRGAMGGLGGACGACHKAYRVPKN